MRDKLIIDKITNAISILDEIDNMIKTQSEELQKVDYKLSDLYHLIENNELSDEASINVVREIHLLRKERRSLNNEHDLEVVYQNQKQKMIGNDSRQFLVTELNKTNKRLNSEYKNRVYTTEQIEKLISPKKKRGRPRKEQ
nr:MAG TPA: AT hook containing protein [Caudoviricetes sp.]